MADWSPRIRFAASGAIEYAAEVEVERERALRDEERARARSAERLAERQAGAEDRKRHEEAMAEFYRPAWDRSP